MAEYTYDIQITIFGFEARELKDGQLNNWIVRCGEFENVRRVCEIVAEFAKVNRGIYLSRIPIKNLLGDQMILGSMPDSPAQWR